MFAASSGGLEDAGRVSQRIEEAIAATAQLLQVCETAREAGKPVDPEEVQQCIDSGADITAPFTSVHQYASGNIPAVCIQLPLLSYLIRSGNSRASRRCLEAYRKPIPFNQSCDILTAPLNALVLANTGCPQYNLELTEAVLHRLYQHPPSPLKPLPLTPVVCGTAAGGEEEQDVKRSEGQIEEMVCAAAGVETTTSNVSNDEGEEDGEEGGPDVPDDTDGQTREASRHDRVNWSEADRVYYGGINFVSLLAVHQLLSTLWPLLRAQVPYFANRIRRRTAGGDTVTAFPLFIAVWDWDWNALPAEFQSDFDLNPVQHRFHASYATGRLWKLVHEELLFQSAWCRETPGSFAERGISNPRTDDAHHEASARQERATLPKAWHGGFSAHLEAVKWCVEHGANVMFVACYDCHAMPILTHLVMTGRLEEALVCLEHARSAIDFTVTDRISRTPLHAITEAFTGDHAYNRALIRAVVQRISLSPEDSIGWDQHVPFQPDFIAQCATHQLLSTLWPELREVPCFADHVEPIQLSGSVWEWDLMALSEEDRARFDRRPARLIRTASQPTGILFKLLRLPAVDLEAVRSCVRDGADLMFPSSLYQNTSSSPSLLCHAARHHATEVLVTMLRHSPLSSLDFTQGERLPSTPTSVLHEISCTTSKEDVQRALRALLDRLERHPEDRIDWGSRNDWGDDPLSHAARWGHLSTWLHVVLHERRVPYYVDLMQAGGHTLRCAIRDSDWQTLSLADQLCFHREEETCTTPSATSSAGVEDSSVHSHSSSHQ